MKAVLLTGHGGPEMLHYGEAPDPTAGFGEVVVDVHAASVNAADYKVRRGGGISSFPYILGRDFSGVVSAVGPGVSDLAVGDAVFGVLDQGIEGAYAEKLAIKAAIIAKKPGSLGHAEAAAMALTSLTALWALEDEAKLAGGETILIQGGAGGVAGFAIQLAKHLGATVITTASPDNHDYVRSLGADRGHRLPCRGLHPHGLRLRRGIRHRRRRGAGALLRGAQARRPPRLDRPGAGGLHNRPAATSTPCAPTSAATAPTWNACSTCSPPAPSGRLTSPATPSPKHPPPTASAKPATCAASWCSRCGERGCGGIARR